MNKRPKNGLALLVAAACAAIGHIGLTADFDIRSYGAQSGGTVCTKAFADAIAAANAAGGGRVIVPKGVWLTGSVHFKSNVELHLEDGAVVEFTDNLSDYLPGVPVSWEGVECINVSPLVYAYSCTNVTITGRGLFRPRLEFWKKWMGRRKPACEKACRVLKDEWAVKGVPVSERRLYELPGAEFRPHFFHFNRCRNVRLEGFSVRGTPFWTVHVFRCRDVVVRDLDLNAFYEAGKAFNNSDGIDIESSRDVLVEGCSLRQGDDAIVIKSGQVDSVTPTENVLVRNCRVYEGHCVVAIGSEIGGGVKNVRCENCRAQGNVWRVCFVKTNPRRGGFVDGITVENFEVEKVTMEAFTVLTRYGYGPPCEPFAPVERPTSIRNLTMRNVTVGQAECRVRIEGEFGHEVENVILDNFTVRSPTERPDRIINAKNVIIDGKPVKAAVSCAKELQL